MNNKPNPDRSFLYFMLRAQQLARQDARSDKGYAMLITSLISIALFSMLAAYYTLTNLSKSSTNAYIDGTSTFYAAESGLNKRAEQLRQKFIEYANPTGTLGNTASNLISSCAPVAVGAPISTTNDYECRNYSFTYNNNIAQAAGTNGNTIVLSEQDGGQNRINYTAYTFVATRNNQNYDLTPPIPQAIPAGQTYAGLNAQEYWYTVYSTAAKPDPNNPTSAVQQNEGKTVLEMSFKSRIVPLFQFAVFYEGDLEMNSSSNMTIGGRVHTNANFYVQPNTNNGAISTTFLAPITSVGGIYNRVDSAVGFNTGAVTNILTAGTSCVAPGVCAVFVPYSSANTSPLTDAQLAPYANRVKAGNGTGNGGVKRLDTPPPGFLRKRNYFKSRTNGDAGEYYAKADMRLEMVPDRDVTSTGVAPWTRDTRIIPFNFNSITTSGSGACTTTLSPPDATVSTGLPSLTSDPAANYVSADRNNVAALRCNVFTKGQLQSLRQPVLVLTNFNQPDVALRTPTGVTPAANSESAILGRPTTFPGLPVGLSAAATLPANQIKILRALQVAIASTPTPITLDQLNTPFSDPTYTTVGTPLNAFRQGFRDLISIIPGITAADRLALVAATPNQVAALGGAWFLPAPIQRIENSQPLVQIAANPRNSGFYDGREQRWMTMLQTNIASLSVWNRDGVYVEATQLATGTGTPDINLRTAYQTNFDMQAETFNNGSSVGSTRNTNNLAFDRAVTIPATPKGLQTLGLGSVDNTEGGLVLHATVSDDLNGDGVVDATNDVSLDTTLPIYKRDAVGGLVDASNNPTTIPLIIDYARKYRGGGTYQSPFGFAFNGGNYLPGALTLVTDRAIYVQGDFNNNGAAQTNALPIVPPDANRLPASLVGDTITVLSANCVVDISTTTSAATTTNHLGVPVGQLNCGLPRANTGSVNVTVGGVTPTYYGVTRSTAVNAAFLSNTDRSNGNLGAGRYDGGTRRFSGALNNYMRMLENWNPASTNPGRFFNYSGSFVSLGTPLEANGAYNSAGGAAAYYNIPTRNFNYELNFDTFTSLPPLPPRAIYLQQDVFKRAYN